MGFAAELCIFLNQALRWQFLDPATFSALGKQHLIEHSSLWVGLYMRLTEEGHSIARWH